MSRLLAVLLALTGLTLVSSPDAHAAVQHHVELSIRASASKVAEGEQVTIRGKARHADLRTRVQLQRRVAGVWTRVVAQRISDTRHYSFTVAPPRGPHRYRAVTVRRTHQKVARSATIGVGVSWTPALTLTAEPVTTDDGQYVDITGAVHRGPSEQTVDVQWRYIGAPSTDFPNPWNTSDFLHPSGTTPFTVRESRDQGVEYRLRLEPTELTPEVLTAVVDDTDPPFVLPLNSGLTLRAIPGGSRVKVPATDGDEVTLDAGPATVTSPSGDPVANDYDTPCSCSVFRFLADQTGDYVVTLTSGISTSATIYASTPKVIDVEQGDTAPHVHGDLPAQQVELRFDAALNDAFTFPGFSACCDSIERDLLGPDGSTVDPWFPSTGPPATWAVYRAPVTGTYRYRFTPYGHAIIGEDAGSPGDVTVLPAIQLSATVDGPPVTTPVVATDQAVIVSVVMGPEDVENVTTTDSTNLEASAWSSASASALRLEPRLGQSLTAEGQGQPTESLHWAPAPGTMTFTYSSPLQASATVDGEPTAIDASSMRRRYIDVSFTGTAGQIVQYWPDGGFCCPTVTDDGGQSLRYLGGDYWELPADGDYVLHLFSGNFGTGDVSLTTVPTYDVSSDGAPVTVSIDEPYQVSAVRITGTPGASVTAVVDQVSASLGGDGQWEYACACLSRNHDSMPLTLPASGTMLGFFWGEHGATGTVRLTVSPSG